MQDVTVCNCGAKVRVPPGVAAASLRCPRCREPLFPAVAAPAAAPAYSAPFGDAPQWPPRDMAASEAAADVPSPAAVDLPVATARELGADGMCPICQTKLAPDDMALQCPECKQAHHRDCWAEVGGCSTYGCSRAPAPVKEPAPAAAPAAGWGDWKQCPMCRERIRSSALKCRYCGAAFATVDPLSAFDVRAGRLLNQNAAGDQKTAVTLFVLSLIGVLAPIILIIAAVWTPRHSAALSRGGPFYLVLGYSAVGVSVLYCIMGLLILLTG